MAEVNNYLSSIGVIVKIDGKAVAGATAFSDMGADAAQLDATKLTDTVNVYVPGVQNYDTWTVTYLFNNNLPTSDFRTLNKVMEDTTQPVDIEVDFSDGTVAKNTGIPSSNKVSGAAVNSMLSAVAAFMLQDKWEYTDPVSV